MIFFLFFVLLFSPFFFFSRTNHFFLFFTGTQSWYDLRNTSDEIKFLSLSWNMKRRKQSWAAHLSFAHPCFVQSLSRYPPSLVLTLHRRWLLGLQTKCMMISTFFTTPVMTIAAPSPLSRCLGEKLFLVKFVGGQHCRYLGSALSFWNIGSG